MAKFRTSFAIGVAALGMIAWADAVRAQALPNSNPRQRDCQTVRTCEFRRDAPVRGCLSSYSCRLCTTVRVPCSLGGRRTCEELRCDWGA